MKVTKKVQDLKQQVKELAGLLRYYQQIGGEEYLGKEIEKQEAIIDQARGDIDALQADHNSCAKKIPATKMRFNQARTALMQETGGKQIERIRKLMARIKELEKCTST